MKKSLLITAALALMLAGAPRATAAITVGTKVGAESDWVEGNAIQETTFAGLGNNNELLATGCYQMPSFTPTEAQLQATGQARSKTYTETYTYTDAKGNSQTGSKEVVCNLTSAVPNALSSITVNYNLSGEWRTYCTKIKVWVRELTGKIDENDCGVDNIFTRPFDYRDPVTLSGAIQLGEVAQGSASGTLVCMARDLKPGHKYMIYLTANIKSASELSSPLPAIKGSSANFTKIGGMITSIESKIAGLSGATYTGSYTYDTYEPVTYLGFTISYNKTVNVTHTEAAPLTLDTPMTATTIFTYPTARTTACANGSRVLVPVRRIMFSPGDYYSKYYRIPAVTTNSDGSLLAITDARKYHPHDIANDIDILALRNLKGDGQIWQTPITIMKGVARESDGSLCALNAKGVVADLSTLYCPKSSGSGDASFASLPNGKTLLCMIHGMALSTGSLNSGTVNGDNDTDGAYVIGSNNGASWSDIKYIPQSVTLRLRGCFGPGNLCVPKNSQLLNGKVLGAYRVGASGQGAAGNLIIIYDPATDTWTRVKKHGNTATYGDLLNIGTHGTDDEAHFIEIGNNEFLYSARGNASAGSSTSKYRNFAKVTISKADNGDYEYTWTAVTDNTSPRMFTTACNADMLTWQPAGETQARWLHTGTDYANNALLGNDGYDRTNLKLYMRDATLPSNNQISWTKIFSLSDPLECRNETAQYASMTVLRDGSLGVLFEENPIGIYFSSTESEGPKKGDYILQSIYLQLRPEDILPNYTRPAIEAIKAPVITPKTNTYYIHDFAQDFADGVTITNPNWQEGNTAGDQMEVAIEYETTDGLTHNIFAETVSTQTYHKTYAEIVAQLATSNVTLAKGMRLRAIATATRGGGATQARSDQALEVYYLADPVRNIVIEARSVTNTSLGTPTLNADARSVGPNQVLTLEVGSLVRIEANQATQRPYIDFDHFSIEYAESSGCQTQTIDATTPYMYNGTKQLVQMSGNQITFRLPPVPAADAVQSAENPIHPDNYNYTDKDGVPSTALKITVWYKYSGGNIGLKSQVTTAYHGSSYTTTSGENAVYHSMSRAASDGDFDDNAFEQHAFAGITTTGDDADHSWFLKSETEKNADFHNTSDDAATVHSAQAEEGELFLPVNHYDGNDPKTDWSKKAWRDNTGYSRRGVSLTVGVLPDAETARKFDGIIMFAYSPSTSTVSNSSNTNSDLLRDKNGNIIYALLQGQQRNTYLSAGAYRVGDWFHQLVEDDGSIVGRLVDDRAYPNEDKVTATTDTTTTKSYGLTHKYPIGTTAPASDTSTANSFYNSLRNDNTPAKGITFYDLDMMASNFPDLTNYNLYAVVSVIDYAYQSIDELTNVVAGELDPAHYTLYHQFYLNDVASNLPTAVGRIGDDQSDEPVYYYNLQGMAVPEPEPTEPGVYLRRQGHTVTKVIVK